MTTRGRVRGTLVAAAAIVVATTWHSEAGAHHSFAMYDQSELRTFTGRLTRFIPAANHAQLIFELLDENGQQVLNADGTPVMWGAETGPSARIAQQGVTPQSFPVGTILTLQVNPLRDGRTFGAMPNGTLLVNCGLEMPTGGCTAETGRVYFGQNE